MDDNGTELTIVGSEDGFLVLGSPGLVESFVQRAGQTARPLGSKQLSKVSAALSGVSRAQQASGKWVKLTPESAALMRSHNITQATSGVLRSKNGQILKHLKFENAALVTPAAPAALAAMASQAAIEAALDEIKEYLAEIDAKLDRLLKQKKVEVLGQVGGIMLALDEADAIYRETGVVSEVTWSKVQSNSTELQTMQAESIGHIAALSDDIAAARKNPDKLSEALSRVAEDLQFWLGVLARAIALQDRQYVLELARVADANEDQADAHRRGISIARANRGRRVAAGLERVANSIRSSSNMSNFARVANPFSSQTVTRRTNEINKTMTDFAEHVELEFAGGFEAERRSWRHSAQGFVGDSVRAVGAAGSTVAGAAKSVGGFIQDKAEDTLIERAERIKAKRGSGAKTAIESQASNTSEQNSE